MSAPSLSPLKYGSLSIIQPAGIVPLYLHTYYQFCLNGRDVNNIEKQFVEISKKYSREAVVKAGGKVAAQIATWDGKNFKWLPDEYQDERPMTDCCGTER